MKQKKEPPKTAKDFELTALYVSKEYLIDNEEVEKKLIGVMLQYSDIHADFFARVSSAMFAYEFPRMVFTAAEALYHQGKNIDIFTVWEEIKRGGAEDDHNLIFFNMGQLGAGMTEHYYLNDNILILQSYYTRRQGYLLLGNMIQKMQTLTEDAADVLTETIQLCTGLLAATGATEQLKEMPEVMKTVFDALALRMEQGAQGVTGIDMGIPTMNELLMGWQPGYLYIIAALTGSGKTAFMLHSALQAARQGKHVLIISLEMSALHLGKVRHGVHRLPATFPRRTAVRKKPRTGSGTKQPHSQTDHHAAQYPRAAAQPVQPRGVRTEGTAPHAGKPEGKRSDRTGCRCGDVAAPPCQCGHPYGQEDGISHRRATGQHRGKEQKRTHGGSLHRAQSSHEPVR